MVGKSASIPGYSSGPETPVQIGVSGYGWHLDAECSARLGHPNGGEEVKRDGEAGDQCSKVKHRKNSLEATASPSITGQLQISYPAVATGEADRPLPIGDARCHPAAWVQRDTFDVNAHACNRNLPCGRKFALPDVGLAFRGHGDIRGGNLPGRPIRQNPVA